LDFYCPEERLAIELDGAIHDYYSAQRHDQLRDEFLRGTGIRVLRFQNDDVMRNFDGVMSEIRKYLSAPSRSLDPS